MSDIITGNRFPQQLFVFIARIFPLFFFEQKRDHHKPEKVFKNDQVKILCESDRIIEATKRNITVVEKQKNKTKQKHTQEHASSLM